MAVTRCPKHDVVVNHPDDGELADADGFAHCPQCKEESGNGQKIGAKTKAPVKTQE